MPSSVKLTSISKSQDIGPFTYKDISLDIHESRNLSDFGLYSRDNITDIEQSLDYEAISNSIINIFNTTPGEKILNPEFGLNLRRYLFDPLSIDTAENIGDTIVLGLNAFEPRVRVININVVVDFDLHEYEITLRLEVPALNNNEMKMTGLLDTKGFTTIPSEDIG